MSDLPDKDKEAYLGDGLYVSFDGYQLTLRASRFEEDHFVAIEPQVFQFLLMWISRYPSLQKHMYGDTQTR